jgi:hypothetical protein
MQGDLSLPLTCALKSKKRGLNGFDWTHLFVVYADDVSSWGENISIVKKTTNALQNVNKDVGLEILILTYLIIYLSKPCQR